MSELCNFESEQGVIGLVLSHHQHLDTVRDKLSVEDFSFSEHQDIFSLCCQLQDEGKRPSPVDIRPLLQWSIDEAPVLAELIRNACLPMTLDQRCQTIKELANRRKLSHVSERIIEESGNLEIPLEQITASLENVLDAVSDTGEEWKTVSLADVMDDVYNLLDAQDNVDFVPTGIKAVDDIIDGFFPSRLYVIGAPPGCAKTTLALNMASNVAKAGHPVAFFNLEMANKEMIPRVITNHCYEEREIAYRNFARKDFNEVEWGLIRSARIELNKLPLVVRDDPFLTISKIRRECRKLKRKLPGLKVVFIDYLQLMGVDGKDTGNDVAKYTQISRGLKLLAKELKIAVVALSQLSRSHENRENKRPQNSDLRGSGSIEQDANCILFNYYHHKYLVRDEPKKKEDWDQWLAEIGNASGKIEIIVGKNREGAEGVAHCSYSAPAAAIR